MEKKFRQYATIVAVMVAVLFLGQAIGSTGAETEMDGKVADIKDLKSEIKSLKEEKENLSKGNEELLDIVKNRDSVEADMKKLNSEHEKLKKKIAEKKEFLGELVGEIIMANSKPITLGAGQYVIGKDIPAGRYRVTNIGEGSNFVVTSGEGELKVNTILGSYGVKDYTFFGETGDNLETGSSIKLEKVK